MELFLVFERWCFALSDGTESEEWERLAGVGGLREEVLVGWLCFFCQEEMRDYQESIE